MDDFDIVNTRMLAQSCSVQTSSFEDMVTEQNAFEGEYLDDPSILSQRNLVTTHFEIIIVIAPLIIHSQTMT